MDRNYQQLARRAQARARAIPAPRQDHRILLMVVYMLISAIIALWLAYLPTITASVLTQLNIVPQHLTAAETMVNRDHKGDRLATLTFDERWKAVATIDKAAPARRAERIPHGCEGAFSGLVKAGNFSTRCVV